MIWKNAGHEFDDIAIKICNNKSDYIIWGAGTFGEAFYKEFSDDIRITAFVDSNVKKQGKKFCGLPVYDTEYIKQNREKIVLVSTGRTQEVFPKLIELGFKKGEDFFHIDEFITLYRMYQEDKLYVSNLNINITDYCSLRCEKCSALNPYLKKKCHLSIAEIQSMLDTYFRWVDHVSILGIVGGDAMVHPQFEEIVEMIGKRYYKKQVGNLEVYSNAVIIPSEHCLELLNKYDVIYRFSDYGEETRDKQKCEQIVDILRENGIRYDWAKFEQWSDCGYPQESNGIKEEEMLSRFYDSCDRRSCQGLINTKLFYCGMAIGAEKADYCAADKNDYFELDQQVVDKKILMEFMLGYNARGYIEYCKKCNGGPNINKYHVRPGVQIKEGALV